MQKRQLFPAAFLAEKESVPWKVGRNHNKKENKITIIPYTEELEKEVEALIDEIENFINEKEIIENFIKNIRISLNNPDGIK